MFSVNYNEQQIIIICHVLFYGMNARLSFPWQRRLYDCYNDTVDAVITLAKLFHE